MLEFRSPTPGSPPGQPDLPLLTELPHSGAFSQSRRIHSYDVGPDHRLTIPGLLRHLHDVAQAHASFHGFGYHGLLDEGRAWALASLELHFGAELPLGETEFEIATSVSRAAGPVVYRDYAATSEAGAVAFGQSMWALIDLESRLTAPPSDALRACLREIAHRRDDIPTVRRLAQGTPLPQVDRRRVRLHDCDFNGHLNNTISVQWMLDALASTMELGGSEDLVRPERLSAKLLRVTYHQEAVLGQTLDAGLALRPLASGSSGERLYELELRNDQGALIVNAELSFAGPPPSPSPKS